MANEENLTPNSERTPNERREIAKKGGKASGKARRKKKTLKLAIMAAMEAKSYEVDGETKDGYAAVTAALIKKALTGDVSAINSLRDTMGEKPTDKVEMDTEIKVVFGVPRPDKGKSDGD